MKLHTYSAVVLISCFSGNSDLLSTGIINTVKALTKAKMFEVMKLLFVLLYTFMVIIFENKVVFEGKVFMVSKLNKKI